MDRDQRDREDAKGERKPRPVLDMGLGSREQGFCKQNSAQNPKLKLVHSREANPA